MPVLSRMEKTNEEEAMSHDKHKNRPAPAPVDTARLDAAVALAAYAKHDGDCVALDPYHVERPDKPCTCGYRDTRLAFLKLEALNEDPT